MQMIELTELDGEKVIVNPQFITMVNRDYDGDTTVCLNEDYFHVRETYEEVKEMLQNVTTEETALLHLATRLDSLISVITLK